MKILQYFSYLLLLSIIVVACKHTDDTFLYTHTRPFVTGKYFISDKGASLNVSVFSDAVTDTLAYKIVIKGSIQYVDSTLTVLDYGHVWSTLPNPVLLSPTELGDSAVSALGKTRSNFVDTITNLKMLTKYYIRSYVITKKADSSIEIGYNPIEQQLATISAKNEWIKRQSLQGASREGSITLSMNNKGYVIGGLIGLSYTNDMWIYDPSTASWQQSSESIPGKRGFGVGFTIDGKIYAGLGEDNLGNLGDFYVYDGINWKTINDKNNLFPGGKRTKALGFSISNNGYVGAGDVGAVVSDFYKFTVSEFEQDRNPWTKINPIGIARKGACVGVVNDFAYVTLGEGTTGNMLTDTWIFSPESETWRSGTEFPGIARKGAFTFTIYKDYTEANFQAHSEFYIGGGIAQDSTALGDCWVFYPEDGKWEPRADYPIGSIIYASGFSLKYQRDQESFATMKGFVVGGYTGTKYVNYLYEFLP